jgi:hypothetical protein
MPRGGENQMSSGTNEQRHPQPAGSTAGGDITELQVIAAELKRMVARPLSPRHVASYTALPSLPAVQTIAPPGTGPTHMVRAIVEVVGEAIGRLDGQTVRLKRLPPLPLDATTIQNVVGSLVGINVFGQTGEATAPERRALAAKALGYDLATLGGDKGFRELHEPVLLLILSAQLLSEGRVSSWFVENVRYHYRYNPDRVLDSTNYRYEVISQRDGDEFFINHTAAENLGGFELVGWKNCEVLERNQLENRTIELGFQLRTCTPGSRTHFSYELKPTDPQSAPDTPRLITIGQTEVASVNYVIDFERPPEKVWTLGAIPPPLAGSPQLELPLADDDPRLLTAPYDHVSMSFRSLRIRHFYGIAWIW